MSDLQTEIKVGSGFWYDAKTQYLVQFSDKSRNWNCRNQPQTITIPPIGHKEHEEAYRHEQYHAVVNNWFEKRMALLILYALVRFLVPIKASFELYVCIRSNSLIGGLKSKYNILFYITALLMAGGYVYLILTGSWLFLIGLILFDIIVLD